MSKLSTVKHGPCTPRKISAGALVGLVLALAAPAAAGAASWTDLRPAASWTDSRPAASWTDSRPKASWTDSRLRPVASWTDRGFRRSLPAGS
jgi:hypothetical protein